MEIKALKRSVVGRKVKQLRKTGLVPAEIFGHGIKNEHLSVSQKELAKIYKSAGEHELVTVAIEGAEKISVLISDAQRDAISGDYLSVDFHAVRMDEKICVKIPFTFIGEAPAIKKGLPIIKVIDEIEIETLPGKMPREFVVDLSSLDDINKSIYVKDIAALKDTKIFVSPESVIVTVGEKTKEEVVAPAPAPAEAAATAETKPASETK